MDKQFTDDLMPLLESIIKERTDGIYKFYKSKSDEYRFHTRALMIVLSKQTGLALQHHAKKVLDAYYICSN